MKRIRLLSLLIAVAFAVSAVAQIGDVPKRRAKKDAGAPARKVWTTEDISREAPPAPPGAVQPGKPGERLAPFVPSPEAVVEEMLKIAEVKAGDTVYDLGCGDGRIMIIAAQKFGANAVGVELDPDLFKRATARVAEAGLQDKVKVIQGDMLQQDLTGATVVTLYLLSSANEKLRPIMEKQLKPGTRVVSHDFIVPGWTPEKTHEFKEQAGGEVRDHVIYLYRR